MNEPNLVLQIEQARAEEARLADARRAAYDRDPGNIDIGHNIFQAYGSHHAFQQWDRARLRLLALEKKLEDQCDT